MRLIERFLSALDLKWDAKARDSEGGEAKLVPLTEIPFPDVSTLGMTHGEIIGTTPIRFSIAEMQIALSKAWAIGAARPDVDFEFAYRMAMHSAERYRREQNRLARKSTRKPREQEPAQ
jgi:hypothetical protein